MFGVIEPPKNEVVIKCQQLTIDEKIELETFLESQPKIKNVQRQMFARDRAFDRDTLGYLTDIPWDLVVVLGDSVKEAAPSVVALIGLFYLARKDRMQEEKERKHEEDDNIESIAIVEPSGQVVSIVKKPKVKTVS